MLPSCNPSKSSTLLRVFVSNGGVASEVLFAPLTENSRKLSSSDWVEDPSKWLQIDVGSGQDPRLSLWAPCWIRNALSPLVVRRMDSRTYGVISTCVGNWPLHQYKAMWRNATKQRLKWKQRLRRQLMRLRARRQKVKFERERREEVQVSRSRLVQEDIDWKQNASSVWSYS